MNIKNGLSKILDPLLCVGQKQTQWIFKSLHLLALKGLGFGDGAEENESGEKQVIELLSDKKEPLTIFDCGASIGGYTENILKLLPKKAKKIYSFEPGETFPVLKKNFKNEEGVFVQNFGLGEANKKATLFLKMASIYNRKIDGVEMDKGIPIEIKTIDSFCEENNIEHIDLLKMDIEGNEFNALIGANNMLKKRAIDIIQFEFGGCDIDAKIYFKDFYYLLEPNFRLYRILRNGLYEINRYRESDEVFLTTNYLAIKK